MNTYLEKLARLRTYAEVARTYRDRVVRTGEKGIGISAATGAGIGAVVGGTTLGNVQKDARGKKYSKPQRVLHAVQGAISGGILGLLAGGNLGELRQHKLYTKYNSRAPKYMQELIQRDLAKGRSRGPSGATAFRQRTVSDIMRDLDHTGFKTKAEATAHYRRSMMKHHPDRPGGSVQKTQQINKAWDDFHKHPEGFNKLAMAVKHFLRGK